MKIKVRLFATLRQGRGKELLLDADENTKVLEILHMLDIKQEDVTILLINGKDGNFETRLSEGDTVSMFPPVGGG